MKVFIIFYLLLTIDKNLTNIIFKAQKNIEIVKQQQQIKAAQVNGSCVNGGLNPPPNKIICVDLTIDSDDENDFCKKTNNKNEGNIRFDINQSIYIID